jgi:hypothetical protein
MSPLQPRHTPQFGNRWSRRTVYQETEFLGISMQNSKKSPNWRLLSSETRRRVVWQIFIDVSEERIESLFTEDFRQFTACLLLILCTLKKETVPSTETSVKVYKTVWHHKTRN